MNNQTDRVREIFLAALKVASEGRDAYLREACADDLALRDQVERLLQAHLELGSIADSSAVHTDSTLAEPASEITGTVIADKYKLLEEIGAGGMGTVWMAQQTEPVKRLVAVKLIKPGMDSRQVLARFEAERQALALMDHPNIAKVLDGGTTSGGRPFFVMDLVKGTPITRYCDEHHLTPRQRLDLFVAVCQAVQHAHQKGVIHRDLKPSNVLVALYDGKPVPKVIDFGVAKATGQHLTDKTLVTGFGNIVGTPEYMSPEQAETNNQDIDTRSDIYSLGVLLYELLTGSTPLTKKRVKEAALLELLRVIREEEPPKPSTRLSSTEELPSISAHRQTDPAKLTRLVRGELDWIVMKALEKDRNRRYETANDFAMDVQRYLADEPVRAGPPSAGYRMRKFVRRNRGRLTVAAVVFVAVIVMATSIGLAVRERAAQAMEIAQAETTRVAKVEDQVRESLNAARTFLAANKVAMARQELARARAQLGNDWATLGELGAEVVAGETALDQFQKFQDQIERAHEAEMAPLFAVTAADGSLDTGSQPPIRTGDRRPSAAVPMLLEALRCYGVLEQSDWHSTLEGGYLGTHQVEQIRRLAYEELLWLAEDIVRRRHGHQSDEKLAPTAAARQALVYLGKAERGHRPTPALYSLRAFCYQALGNEEAAQADREQADKVQPTMAVDHYLRGQHAVDAKQTDAAIEAFEAALRVEPTHYWSMMKLGYCLCDRSKRPEDLVGAARVFTGCILKRPDHAHPFYCRAIAYLRLGRYGESLEDDTTAIELDPKFAPAWNNRGGVYNKLGMPDRAVKEFTQAIDLQPKFAIALRNRAVSFMRLGQRTKAIADYSRIIELEPKNAENWNDRGSAHFDLDELDKALADYSQAIKLDGKLARPWHNRGMTYAKLRQPAKAIADISQAIIVDPNVARFRYDRGVLYDAQGEPAKAFTDFSRAIELDADFALAWYNRGVVNNKLNRPDKAIDDYSQAIKLDSNHAPSWNNRGLAYSKLNLPDKAIADLTQAIKLDRKHVSAWAGRGFVYNDLGQLDNAVADFSQAIEFGGPNYPQMASLYRLRAQANSRLGNFEKARADFQEALKIEPKYAWTNHALAWLLATCPDAKLRDPAKAVELASEATRQASKVPDCWRTLGVAHCRAGDWKAAIAALSESRKLSRGGNAADLFFLAMAHWKLGNHKEARNAHDDALQWLETNKKALEKDKYQAEEFRRFRLEAEEVLELRKK